MTDRRTVPYPDHVLEVEELEQRVEEMSDLADLWMELYEELRERVDRYSEEGPEKVIAALEAEVERLRTRAVELEGLLTDCADELERFVKNAYEGALGYPGQRRRYDRDLAPVLAARAALPTEGEPHE
jgi:hypothetical protein